MFNLGTFKLTTRRTAVALGALAVGVFAFSGSANAAPLQLFPFFLAPQAYQQPAPQMQSEDEGDSAQLPARVKRQVVSYATREAAGTVIIDTPNTYLYYVLGGGR